MENRTIHILDLQEETKGALFCDLILRSEKAKRKGKYVPNSQIIGLTREEAKDIADTLSKELGEAKC